MASAGLCHHIADALKINMNPSLAALSDPKKQVVFMDYLKANALKTSVETPLQSIIGRQSVEDSVVSSIRSLAVNTAAAYGAYQLGQAYKGGKGSLPASLHKGSHFALGTVLSFAQGGNLKTSLAAGANALAAEMMAEWLIDPVAIEAQIKQEAAQEGQLLTSKEYEQRFVERLLFQTGLVRLGMAGLTALITRDPASVSMGIFTAANAVENNFMGCMRLPLLQKLLHILLQHQRVILFFIFGGIKEGHGVFFESI